MATAWRLLKTKYASDAFSGEGARLYGGRWNSRGTRIVYLAESISLAVLEILVHLQAPAVLSAYSLISVSYTEDQVVTLPETDLPPGWDKDPVTDETRQIGDEWASSHSSLFLRLPSAIIPQEYNLLLNPQHVQFSGVEIGEPVRFRFDPRLLR